MGYRLAYLHLAEDLVGVIADAVLIGLQGLAVRDGRCVSTKNNRLPDGKGSLRHLDDELARQEALNAFHAAELVDNSFDLTKV